MGLPNKCRHLKDIRHSADKSMYVYKNLHVNLYVREYTFISTILEFVYGHNNMHAPETQCHTWAQMVEMDNHLFTFIKGGTAVDNLFTWKVVKVRST